jgi:hypothetical protein
VSACGIEDLSPPNVRTKNVRKSGTDEMFPFRAEITFPPSHLEAMCHALVCNPLQMSLGGYNEDCLV